MHQNALTNSHAKSAHYKSISEKKSGNQNHGKPYGALSSKKKHKAKCVKWTSGGGTPAPAICFNYGDMGHHVNECKGLGQKCFKCGKPWHCIAECKSNFMTCYNCGEPGHIIT